MATNDVKGMAKIKNAIKRNAEWITDSLARALFDEAQDIMRKSQREVPVEFNMLRNSKVVLPPRQGVFGPTVTMGYDAKYAIYVHEIERYRHKSPTKAKFLSDPLEAAKEGYNDRITKRTGTIWRRKRGHG